MINRFLLSCSAIVISLAVSGQSIELVNLTTGQKESRVIYVGIENKFKIIGFDNLSNIEPADPIVSIQEDTLTLKSNVIGPLTLIFHTKGGKQEVKFEMKIISDVIATIGSLTNRVVDKNDVVGQGKVNIHSFNAKELFYEHYNVSSFEAHISNQIFRINGDKFTDALVTAIKQAKAGDTLVLSSVQATNANTGKTLRISSARYELK